MTRPEAADPLVSPGWLAGRLDDPRVKVFDCAVTREARPDGASIYHSERPAWEGKRIPGAGYLHMVDDLCDPAGEAPFTALGPEGVAALLGARGVGEGDTVVLYGRAAEWAVHRAWWVLSAAGVPDVRVLDGGLARWEAEGRPLERGAAAPPEPAPPPRLSPRPELAADRARVARAVETGDARLVNALSRALFEGRGDQVFGRPGRIPGSVSLPSTELVDPETGCFRPPEAQRRLFEDRGLMAAETVIPYCGGGIAASTLAFALLRAGHPGVRLYDGSLMDWAADPDAPFETGPA
jgi:thiosulfate/3-mercaptopyruvate sulfurtransferase